MIGLIPIIYIYMYLLYNTLPQLIVRLSVCKVSEYSRVIYLKTLKI